MTPNSKDNAFSWSLWDQLKELFNKTINSFDNDDSLLINLNNRKNIISNELKKSEIENKKLKNIIEESNNKSIKIINDLESKYENVCIENHNLLLQINSDDLTWVWSRVAFWKKLVDTVNNYNNKKVSFILSIIDLDNFKTVNDTYWHLFWDDVLRVIWKILNQFEIELWEWTNVFRLWGEEFWIISTNSNKEVFEEKLLYMLKILRNTNIYQSEEITIKKELDFYSKTEWKLGFLDTTSINMREELKTNLNNIEKIKHNQKFSAWTWVFEWDKWLIIESSDIYQFVDDIMYWVKENWRNWISTKYYQQ